MKDATKIVVILDRSGSMANIMYPTIEGFNRFIADQKKVKGEASVKLCQFDHEYEVIFDQPLKKAPKLTEKTYQPRGMTALLDAMGRTITDLGNELAALPESERPNKVIVVTLTDGYENASTDYTKEKVFNMVKHQREAYSWEFIYLGANQDAIAVGAAIGVPQYSSMSYTASGRGMVQTVNSMSNYTTAVRSGGIGGQSVRFTDEDRENAMDNTTNSTSSNK